MEIHVKGKRKTIGSLPLSEKERYKDKITKILRKIESNCGTFDNPRRMTLEETYEIYTDLQELLDE